MDPGDELPRLAVHHPICPVTGTSQLRTTHHIINHAGLRRWFKGYRVPVWLAERLEWKLVSDLGSS